MPASALRPYPRGEGAHPRSCSARRPGFRPRTTSRCRSSEPKDIAARQGRPAQALNVESRSPAHRASPPDVGIRSVPRRSRRAQLTTSPGSPSERPSASTRPCRRRRSPWAVPTTSVPSAPAWIDWTASETPAGTKRRSERRKRPRPSPPIRRRPRPPRPPGPLLRAGRSTPRGSRRKPPARVARPVSVPIQSVPAPSSARLLTMSLPSPSDRPKVRIVPSWRTLRPPPSVPSQSRPLLSSRSARTRLCRSSGAEALSQTTKRIPSNRASPSWVPIQRYPSRVWVSASAELWGSPCRTPHTSCRNWRSPSRDRAPPLGEGEEDREDPRGERAWAGRHGADHTGVATPSGPGGRRDVSSRPGGPSEPSRRLPVSPY